MQTTYDRFGLPADSHPLDTVPLAPLKRTPRSGWSGGSLTSSWSTKTLSLWRL